MFNKKNLIVILCTIIAVTLGICAYLGYRYNTQDFETVSAKLEMDTEDIEVNTDGTVKAILFENFSKVQIGDVIAEIEKKPNKTDCSNDNVSKKITEDYQDSVLMYKDGIITKDEYDASLNKYKTEKKKSCTKTELEPVYAVQNGILVLNKDFTVGSTIKDDDNIGEIRSEKVFVNAYFSPKVAKRIKPGRKALITIIKYPEKQFNGIVSSVDKIDINGQSVKIEITDETTDLNISPEDSAMVKIPHK